MSEAADRAQRVPRCGVVIVAAGRGVRLGQPLPKQFLPLGGLPVFLHSVLLFTELECVSQVVLALPETGLPDDCKGALATLSRQPRRVTGGARRQDSVAAGLAALDAPFEVALVHDAARPFPPPAAIADLARVALRTGGGLLATPASDTIKRASADPAGVPVVAETIDRSVIWLAQTPQAIRADLVPRAIAAFHDPAVEVTDEASLLEAWGIPVALVDGGPGNFKITFPHDLARAETMLETGNRRT